MGWQGGRGWIKAPSSFLRMIRGLAGWRAPHSVAVFNAPDRRFFLTRRGTAQGARRLVMLLVLVTTFCLLADTWADLAWAGRTGRQNGLSGL